MQITADGYRCSIFTDENGVSVKYRRNGDGVVDSTGWWISRRNDESVPKETENKGQYGEGNYYFDKDYLVIGDDNLPNDEVDFPTPTKDIFPEVCIVTFRLVNQCNDVLYLRLYNMDCESYSHEFVFKDGDNVIVKGEV